MANKQAVSFKLNGKAVDVVVEPRELLIHTLREKLSHTGPHIGCETSHCGACTVDLDGKSVKSCTVLTVQCQDSDMDLQKRPGIAETLDWTAALLRLGVSTIDENGAERILESLSALVKTRADCALLTREVVTRLAAAC